jgi:dipeptidyl aminopeptidase/acylaminoacyl peptidase
METRYTIKDFLEVKSSFAPTFSPDGSQIAYLSDLTGTYQLYLISSDGGESVQLTDFSDPVSSAGYSPTEDIIVFAKAEGGNENTQIFSLDPGTKEVTQLTNNKEVRYNPGGFSYDGKLLSFSSNERNGKDFDVYVMDMETREIRCVYDRGGWAAPSGFSRQGTYLVIQVFDSNVNNDTYLCTLSTGEIEHLTPHEGNMLQGALRWLPDESAFYMTMDEGREFMGLARYSMAERKFEYVLTPEWDIEGTTLQRDGKYFEVAINEDGYSKVSIYDPYTLEQLPHAVPAGEVSGAKFSSDGKYMVFSLTDARKTSDIWLLNMETNTCSQLTVSPQGVPPKVLVDPELVRFSSFDELPVPAFIYWPRDIKPGKQVPVVINIHGGPEAQARPALALVTQFLVHSGYAVVVPNVRGSTGYGKTYESLDNIEKRIDSVKDIVALRDYLSTFSQIDLDRIALLGGSYGGFMVLAGLAFYPELWAAGIDIVGIVNFETFLENTASYRRALREVEYGSLETDRDLLKSISPLNSIENVTAPLFVIHGANDPRVPLSEAEQAVSRLKELGREVELIIYPDEGHGLAKLKNRLDAYPKMVSFLEKVLQRS